MAKIRGVKPDNYAEIVAGIRFGKCQTQQQVRNDSAVRIYTRNASDLMGVDDLDIVISDCCDGGNIPHNHVQNKINQLVRGTNENSNRDYLFHCARYLRRGWRGTVVGYAVSDPIDGGPR